MSVESSGNKYRGLFSKGSSHKVKVDDNPFPRDQNMVDARLLKGKTKVLTSTRAKETGTESAKISKIFHTGFG